MSFRIQGLHHVTAIAGNAQRNVDFYTQVLGLRLVKKTVNFDDPSTYHFYFANEQGEPGTILTFFPWEGIVSGRRGPGQATETSFAVPADSFDFWIKRFEQHNVTYNNPAQRFDEEYLTFLDPDGLKLALVIPGQPDPRPAYVTPDISEAHAIRGFQNVALTLHQHEATARILTDVFGYTLVDQQVNHYRYRTDAVPTAATVDLVSVPGEPRGHVAGGSVHHVAFRVADEDAQLYFRDKVTKIGLSPTPQIDRDYFMSIYFREPGGVLFEIATDPPGFTADEPLEALGTGLKLPAMYESRRKEIEQALPPLT